MISTYTDSLIGSDIRPREDDVTRVSVRLRLNDVIVDYDALSVQDWWVGGLWADSTSQRAFFHHVIREDAHDLVAFPNERYRRIFRSLIKAPKIGPKVALRILGAAPVDELLSAKSPEDLRAFPKVGANAQAVWDALVKGKHLSGDAPTSPKITLGEGRAKGAIAAAGKLGIAKKEAESRLLAALATLPEDWDESQALTAILKNNG